MHYDIDSGPQRYGQELIRAVTPSSGALLVQAHLKAATQHRFDEVADVPTA
jgi:hypothetical protein